MGEMVYRWKPKSFIRIDAQAAGERFELLSTTPEGCTPRTVLEDARPKVSPLHEHFVWPDHDAAELYRLQQAGHLIRCICFINTQANGDVDTKQGEDEEPLFIRAFLPVQREDEEGRTYHSTTVVMRDPALKAQVLQQVRAELAAFKRKYAELEELAELLAVVDKMLKNVA